MPERKTASLTRCWTGAAEASLLTFHECFAAARSTQALGKCGEEMKRVMWVEYKGEGIVGPAKIGWVTVKDKGKRLEYGDQTFRSLNGRGFKSNYYDLKTKEEYWITGCRKDGGNALYNTDVEIDEDALEEYWLNIRKEPEKKNTKRFRAQGKY